MLKLVGDRERRGIRRSAVVATVALLGAGLLVIALLGTISTLLSGADNLWTWLSEGESGSVTLRNIGLFVVAVIGLPFAMWRTVVAARQGDVAQRTLRSDRHQKAVEMLGHDTLAVRFGGIYALQHLAKEYSAHYHVQVMQLFCAFLSHSTAPRTSNLSGSDTSEDAAIPEGGSTVPIDVQSVLRAIGDRDCARIELEERDGFELIIDGADLRSFKMYDVHSFTYDLPSWKLIDSKPKRRASLSRAHLRNVKLAEADLSDVDMSRVEFWDPDLTKARLESADLSRTSWDGGTLKGAQMSSADLSKASIRETSLVDANLSSADLSDVILQEVDLSNANLRNAELSGASFSLIKSRSGGAGFTRAGAKQFGLNPEEYIVGVSGLTQAQLDQAWADPEDPPQLEEVLDESTGEPLVWRGGTRPSGMARDIGEDGSAARASIGSVMKWVRGQISGRTRRKRRTW